MKREEQRSGKPTLNLTWSQRCRMLLPRLGLTATGLHWPEWSSPRWFALGVGCFSIGVLLPGKFYRSFPIWIYNAFRRTYVEPRENCWGFGLLQVGSRHLLYIGSNEEERLKLDVAFLHLLKLGPRPTEPTATLAPRGGR